MKVKIIKTIEPDGNWFKVFGNEVLYACFCFDPTEPEDSFNGKERNYERALKKAKEIEKKEGITGEVVYETKEDISEPLQSLNNLQK